MFHLEANRLKRLPSRAFSDFSSLQSLYLNNNAIVAVDVNAFEGLINLSELDLSYNKLETTPSAMFRDFQHLQVIWDVSSSSEKKCVSQAVQKCVSHSLALVFE